jgi:hypothetical protein
LTSTPGKIQSLDRLVSFEDYESEALGLAGVTKAAAKWELIGGVPQVTLTVLKEAGRSTEVEELRTTFATANNGPRRFAINPIAGRLRCVVIKAVFGYDSTYLEAEVKNEIQKALGAGSAEPHVADDGSALFSLRRRGFGQKEYASTVAGVIQQVEGVVWARVEGFEAPAGLLPTGTVDPVTIGNLPIVTCLSNEVSDEVLILQSAHLFLTAQSETVREVGT